MEKDEDTLGELVKSSGDFSVNPAVGIGSIALTLAMKYHDINTVQDGTLYQQYKLEGKNMSPLHIDAVFDTAIRIERHLLATSDRIGQIVVDALATAVDDEDAEATDLEAEAS